MSGRDIYATDAANDNSNDYEFIEMTLGDCDACHQYRALPNTRRMDLRALRRHR